MNQLDLDYQNLLKDILENGVEKNTRNGKVLSVFGRSIRHNFKDGKFPILTTKKMAFKTMVTELLWFLRGDTNIKYLVDNGCHIWDGDAYKNYQKITTREIELNEVMKTHPHYNLSQEEFINKIKTDDKFASQWGSLGKIYGYQWRNWVGEFSLHIGLESDGSQDKINFKKGIDQIANLINDLKTNPDSRRLLVSAWNPSDLDSCVLPPCHYGFQVYTRELSLLERREIAKGKLEWMEWVDVIKLAHYKETYDKYNIPTRAISLMYNCRSQDVPLGTPFNISSYALLLEIIAKEVNMVPD